MHPNDSGRRGFRPRRQHHRHPPFGPEGPFRRGGPGFGPGFGGFGPGFGGPAAPFGPGRHGRGRGRGARRGDVRAAVLALLAERPMHGYEIIQQIEERSGGVWRPSPGSIYPTLQLLADEGLVSADESGGRRLFTLTEAGRAEVEAREGEPPWEQERDGSWAVAQRFRDEFAQLAMAAWQVARVGTDEQREEVLAALADARRRAYRLLADEQDANPAADQPAD